MINSDNHWAAIGKRNPRIQQHVRKVFKMALTLQVVLATTFICSASVVTQQSYVRGKSEGAATDLSKSFITAEQWAHDREIIKAADEHYERDLKDGFQRHAEITIKASSDTIRAWLIQTFTKHEYSVTKNSDDKLSFERKEVHVANRSTPQPQLQEIFQIISFKLSVKNEMTIVEANLRLDVRPYRGRLNTGPYGSVDMNKDRAMRHWITYVLHNLQKATERL